MAKHWKNFIKEEPSNEVLNPIVIHPEEDKKILFEEMIGFNSSLKELFEEQKKLEEQMEELTGGKKEAKTDKKYDHEIKTIDQKKKEEKQYERKKTQKEQREKEGFRKTNPREISERVSFEKKKSKEVSKQKNKKESFLGDLSKKNKKKVDPIDNGLKNKEKPFLRPEKITNEFVDLSFTPNDYSVTNLIINDKKDGLNESKIVDESKIEDKEKKKKSIGRELLKAKNKIAHFENNEYKQKVKKGIDNFFSKGEKDGFFKEVNESKNKLQEIDKVVRTLNNIKKEVNQTVDHVKKNKQKIKNEIQIITQELEKLPITGVKNEKIEKGNEVLKKIETNIDKVTQLLQKKTIETETKDGLIKEIKNRTIEGIDFVTEKIKSLDQKNDLEFLQKKEDLKRELLFFKVDLFQIKNSKSDKGILGKGKRNSGNFI